MSQHTNAEGFLLPDQDRLSGVGRFLRSTSLDELPELINVLKGEMSLVGPRPLLMKYKDLYNEEQWRRHDMPPGMAGPVVARGRNKLKWQDKFELDIWYVDNWSLKLDLILFFETLVNAIRREGINAEGHATMPTFTGDE
jgi:lipopolysaccharide/colanic/teichoic acid biosynthesis glycosyltransferase